MGLSCNKMLSHPKSPESLEKTDSWARSAGYVFRPGFRNELNEVIYEKSQISYSISWRKAESILHKRQSVKSYDLINTDFYSKFKDFIRNGVPDRIAREILLKLFCVLPSDTYWRTLKDHFEDTIPDTFLSVPTFSSITKLEEVVPKFYLTSTGIIATKRMLWALHKLFDAVKFCPQLPGLVSLMLVYLNEEEVFFICEKLVRDRSGKYLIKEILRFEETVNEIGGFLIREIPVLSKFGKDLNRVVADMIRKMFVGYLRINCLLRLMMVYLAEGVFVLCRFICAIFMNMHNINFISTPMSWIESVKLYTFSLQEIDGILGKSFKIQLFNDEDSECRVASERSSCLSFSKFASERYVKEILEYGQVAKTLNSVKVMFSKGGQIFDELLSIAETFPKDTSIVCLFVTTNFEVFGFFSETAMWKNLDNPDSLLMVFELEPEHLVFVARESGLLQVTESKIQIGRKPAFLLSNDMKLFVQSSEEFGEFDLMSNEFEVNLCEVMELSLS